MKPGSDKTTVPNVRPTALALHKARLASGILLLCSMLSFNATAKPHVTLDSSAALDKQVEATLQALTEGNWPLAQLQARQLSFRFPHFALGQLLSAELESVAALQDVLVSNNHNMTTPVIKLLLEAQARLPPPLAETDPNPVENSETPLPATFIQLGNTVSQLLMVDLEAANLTHIMGSDQALTTLQKHYIGSGKAGYGKRVEGDNKTPIGIYRITGTRSDASLPDLYGSGALMLDYPNALDQYHHRTGSGIWLHGVPHAQRSRAPRSSEGCVTMSNDHLLTLLNQIDLSKTLVILDQTISWQSPAQHHQHQLEFRALFERYQQAWVNEELDNLSALYYNDDLLAERFEASSTHLLKARQPSDTSTHSGIQTEQAATANTGTYSEQTQPSNGFFSALATVNPSDVTILLNPTQPLYSIVSTGEQLYMRVRFGRSNEKQVTLFWSRQGNDQWQIITEQWEGNET